ncbi:MAG: glutathione S-transferase family protein [Rhodobacteraceae bacterium]|nr:glutathione S-transferase family protein [Paracoccaceae bacterium]
MENSYVLYHYPLSPFCRKVRLVLAEKKIDFTLREERYWEKRVAFQKLNPAGKVPALRNGKEVFADSQAICEYLEAITPDDAIRLIPEDPREQCEMRRLISFFDEKFNQEVTSILVFERMLRRIQQKGSPDERRVKVGLEQLKNHTKYLQFLIMHRRWIAGDRLTLADFTVAAHLSCLDYVGLINWKKEEYAEIKGWYSRMKSRRAFKPLLSDHVPGYFPAFHYANVDFD